MEQNEATLEKLKELHEIVKFHPFRLDNETRVEEYCKLLHELSECFYWCVQKTEYKLSKNMTHDFNASATALTYNSKHKNGHLLNIERGLGVIHNFINTGKIPKFYDYYPESSIGIDIREYIYVGDGKYEWNLNPNQAEKILALIKEHYNGIIPPPVWDKYGYKTKEMYDLVIKIAAKK